MHTTGYLGVTFIHNGDYSGDVTILDPQDPSRQHRIVVPFAALKSIVADCVRDLRKADLDIASSDRILGIHQE